MDTSNQIDVDEMRRTVAQACQLLRGLAHEDRLLLLCLLSQEELSVGELEQRLGLHQPSLSQQLGVLRREGLVRTRREGRRIHYRVADSRALAMLELLYHLYCGAAMAPVSHDPPAREGDTDDD